MMATTGAGFTQDSQMSAQGLFDVDSPPARNAPDFPSPIQIIKVARSFEHFGALERLRDLRFTSLGISAEIFILAR